MNGRALDNNIFEAFSLILNQFTTSLRRGQAIYPHQYSLR